MPILYTKESCIFSSRVKKCLEKYGIDYELKDAANPTVRTELVALGGKVQTPFLVDGSTCLYESRKIITHIERTYGSKETDTEYASSEESGQTQSCTCE